ncbi:glycerophosphodiester phosphodiesterase [Alsobacter sp. SYSU M60028]|uniref:Glycerophosphodiester phosphodiesterase n=1 Tax=Alsobacter ponti TaxID=2962936 RepID=A0ABT1L679_9HYPH|nr:glycerophosphodiester phosphodiesterase family protein [Alsobacter ponti]MCP8936895.1 glycerophosphodiester phosphodiesterase [Alsobacter ponti]
MPYLPLASTSGFIHVCGHRGHSVGAPENTIPALTEAARLGASVCEIDVVLTADDEIVLMHDEICDRTTDGEGRVGAMTLAELRKLDAGAWFGPAFAGVRAPTLAEALDTARGLGISLLVEIKERQRAGLMIELLAQTLTRAGAVDDVLVISFDHPSLRAMRERLPYVRTEAITHARHVDPVAVARSARVASVAIEWDMFHPDDARALHSDGIATRVTIPRPERIAYRAARGLDLLPPIRDALRAGLIDVLAGDDAAFVRALVAECGAPPPARA